MAEYVNVIIQNTQLTRWPKLRGKRNYKWNFQVMEDIMYLMVPTCEHESLICVTLLLVNVCIIGYIQLCITSNNIPRCQGPNVHKTPINNDQSVPYCLLTKKWQFVTGVLEKLLPQVHSTQYQFMVSRSSFPWPSGHNYSHTA